MRKLALLGLAALATYAYRNPGLLSRAQDTIQNKLGESAGGRQQQQKGPQGSSRNQGPQQSPGQSQNRF